MTSTLIDLADRKGKPCPNCGVMHIIQNKCRYEDLIRRVALLMEANALIPSILQANKEAVDTAKSFQRIIQQADAAHTVLMEVLTRHGEVGKQIQDEYFKELDSWAKETSSRATEQLSLGIENSTSKEIEDKGSTEETKTGESSQENS